MGRLIKGKQSGTWTRQRSGCRCAYLPDSSTDIFVGGDVYTGPKFAIDAIAAGKQGAISIHRFVQPHSSLTIGRNRNDFIELDTNDIKVENYDNSSRQIPGHHDSIDTKHSFRDAKLVFPEEQVKAETARCLGCGASVVDQNKCIGLWSSVQRSVSLMRSSYIENCLDAARWFHVKIS